MASRFPLSTIPARIIALTVVFQLLTAATLETGNLPESLSIQCPLCGVSIALKSRKLLGKKARCTACSRVITLSLSAQQDTDLDIDDEYHAPDTTPLFDQGKLPRKPSKKKARKKSSEVAQVSASAGFFRDEVGSPTVLADLLRMTGLGCTGGLLSMLLWSGLIWLTGLRLGFAAILAGFAVGVGVKRGSSERNLGLAPALLSSSIATIILTTAQLLATDLQNRKYQAEFAALRAKVLPVVASDEAIHRLLAEEVIQKRLAQDIAVDWSEVDAELRNASEAELLEHPDLYESLYPPDVWGEAEQLFEGYPAAEIERLRSEIREQWDSGPAAIDRRSSRFLSMMKTSPRQFDRLDLVYFLTAITLAFVIAKPAKKRT